MTWVKLLIGTSILVFGLNLLADETPTSHPNPYVDLYLQRVIEAEAAHQKSLALKKLADVKVQMYKKLVAKGACSVEEYLEKEAAFDVAASGVEEAIAYIAETKSLYRLSLVRTEAGQDMPICLR